MKWTFRFFAALLLLTIALVTHARRAETGWITFYTREQIFLMTDDGASARQVAWENQLIFRLRADRYASQWSPQRDRIVFVGGESSLYIDDIAHIGDALLMHGYDTPYWSPDGDWIYARPAAIDAGSLHRIHIETGRVEALPTPPHRIWTMSWSDDGARVVMVFAGDEGDELFHMARDGGAPHTISDGLPPRIDEPRFSPDGEWIAFIGFEGRDDYRIYRIRPDGGELQQLAERASPVWDLQWSPDGAWLLFAGVQDGLIHLFRMRADGSSLQNLGFGSSPRYALDFELTWRPLWVTIASVMLLVVSITDVTHLLRIQGVKTNTVKLSKR